MGFFLLIILLSYGASWTISRPLDQSSSTGPVATVDFLKKFGYLEVSTNGSESEAIYSEESIQNAISQMQTFGGLNPTGILDDETRELLHKPRCGVPDIIRNSSSPSHRSKRFVIGAKGWNKRNIAYSFENWSPKLGESAARKEMQKAFDIWSPYSNLRFTWKPLNADTDIKISFGRYSHGDRFPFDGKGYILAHAYFPHDYGSLGGDIHFDEDEDWWSPEGPHHNLRDPVNFGIVATHEIGHSLGLAHSSDVRSIMFPYYQGQGQVGSLGYDDILAVYELYIQRAIPDNHPSGERDSSSEEGSSTTTIRTTTKESMMTTEKQPTSTTTMTTARPTTVKVSSTTKRTTGGGEEGSTEVEESSGSKEDGDNSEKDYNEKDLCITNVPLKIAFLRNEIFVFHRQYMWRLTGRGNRPPPAYPVKIARLFPPLTNLHNVDAAYERDSDASLIFFSGNQFWVLDGTEATVDSPKPLSALGLPSSLTKLDAAFVWEKNHLTYFFSGNLYWRYNDTAGKMDEGYPLNIERWGGIPTYINSVIRYKDGKTYFFSDDGEFWRFDDMTVHVEENFPLQTKNYWFGC